MERHTCDEGPRCDRCNRPGKGLRRGLCPRCYMAAWRGAETGAACEACEHADPRALVRRRMPDEGGALAWHTVCANCTTVAGKRALTLEALRVEVRPMAGDRRTGAERRRGERRGAEGDRRTGADRVGVGDRRTTAGRRASDQGARPGPVRAGSTSSTATSCSPSTSALYVIPDDKQAARVVGGR